jgi:hypothetical protein
MGPDRQVVGRRSGTSQVGRLRLRSRLSEAQTLGGREIWPFRSNASLNGPSGLCQAESFGDSFADSVSFRLSSWQSLDGHPVAPANYASGPCHPVKESSANKKIERQQAAYKPVAFHASPRSVGNASTYRPTNVAAFRIFDNGECPYFPPVPRSIDAEASPVVRFTLAVSQDSRCR